MFRKTVLSLVTIFMLIINMPVIAENDTNDSDFHAFVNFGVSGLFLNMPKFGVGSKDYSSDPLVTFNSSKLLPAYHFGIGYHFCDDKYALIFRFNFLNYAKTNNNENLGNGRVWLIDGSGSLFPGFISSDIEKTKITGKYHRDDYGLYFQGTSYFANNNFFQNPYFGFVYNHLTTGDDYQSIYDAGFFSDTDIENYRTKTNYYGIAIGDKFNFQMTNKFTTFINLDAELLWLDSHLSAYQNPAVEMNAQGSPPPFLQPKTISNNEDAKITYRAITALGVNYKLLHFYQRDIVGTVAAGFDFWGYTPKIVTCINSDYSAAHLHGVPKVDSFVTLSITVPIF